MEKFDLREELNEIKSNGKLSHLVAFASGYALAKTLSSKKVERKLKTDFFFTFALGVCILYLMGSYVIEKHSELFDRSTIIKTTQLYDVIKKNNQIYYVYKSNNFDLSLISQLKGKSIYELDLSKVNDLTDFEISLLVKLDIHELKLCGLKQLTNHQVEQLIKFEGNYLDLSGLDEIDEEQIILLKQFEGKVRVNEKVYEQIKEREDSELDFGKFKYFSFSS